MPESNAETDKPRTDSPLRRYLERLREREGEAALEDFARRVGTSARYLEVIARGTKAPRPRLMRGIVEASGGRVTYRHLVESSPGLDHPTRAGRSTILEARRGQGRRRKREVAA